MTFPVSAILTPTTPNVAFPIGEKQKDPIEMYLNDVLTVPASLAGLPAISVTAGKNSNNLPIGMQVIGRPFEEISVNEWDLVMSVNLRGVFLCAKAASPIMKAQKYGKIINIASDTMMKGTTHFAHYVSSKGGVFAFTRAIAKEIGEYGICVNSIAPGLTCTDVMEAEENFTLKRFDRSVSARSIQRIQQPEDLVGTIIYLASSDSDFVTGQCIVVNGGDNLY